jgi:hypothetical protein
MHKRLIWDPVQYSNYYGTQPSHAPVVRLNTKTQSMVREHKKGIERDEKTICIMSASWKTKR